MSHTNNTNKSQEAALSYMMGFQHRQEEEEDPAPPAPDISLRSIDSGNSSMRSTEFEEFVHRFFHSQDSVRSHNDSKELGLTEIGMPAPDISLRSIDSGNSSMRSTEFEECVRRFFHSQDSVRSHNNDSKEQGLTEIGMMGPVEFRPLPLQQQGQQDQDHHYFMDSQDSFQHGMLDMMRMMSIDSTLPPFKQQEAPSDPKIHPLNRTKHHLHGNRAEPRSSCSRSY